MASAPVLTAYAEAVAELTRDGPFRMREVDAGGRKVRIFERTLRNLPAFFTAVEARFSERDLVAEGDRRWTYDEIFGAARRLGGALRDRYGVEPGDRVGVVMRNRAEWLIAFIAALRIGAVAVLFNSRGSADELAAAAAQTTCKVSVADAARAERLRAGGDATPLVLVEEEAGQAAAIPGAVAFHALVAEASEALDADPEPDAPAAILFTSGTTGRAKGAVLTHRNLTALISTFEFNQAIAPLFAAKRGAPAAPAANPPPLYSALLVFPLFHVSGVMAILSAMLVGGMLTTMRRWRAEDALALIEANRITSVTGPSLVLSDLLDLPGAAQKLATVTRFLAGGQATPMGLVQRVAEMLPQAFQGVGWGSTETTGGASGCTGAVFDAKPDSCGLPFPISDVRVADDAGRELPQGGIGELWVRGAMVTPGYWNAPEATAAAFHDDWYKTGDVGFIDPDGFIYVVDRKKDMVISAGENVYCAEVERVLATDPAFSEVALFGIPDVRLGERAIAAVSLREGWRRSEAEVQALVGAALADYKVPAAVVFDLSPLPRTATGKVDKRRLRASYLERAAS